MHIALRLWLLTCTLVLSQIFATHARNNEHETLKAVVGSGLSHLYTLRHPKLNPEQFRFLRENHITRQVVEQSFVEVAEEIATEKEVRQATPHLEILKAHFPDLRTPIEEYEESYGQKKEIAQFITAVAKNPNIAAVIKNIGIGVAIIWFLRRILGTARDSMNNETEKYARGMTTELQHTRATLSVVEQKFEETWKFLIPLLRGMSDVMHTLKNNFNQQHKQMKDMAELGQNIVDRTQAMCDQDEELDEELLETTANELETSGTLTKGTASRFMNFFRNKRQEAFAVSNADSASQPRSPLLSRRSSLQNPPSTQILSLEDYSNSFYESHGTRQSNQTAALGKRQVRKNSVGSSPSSSSSRARATRSGSSSGSTRTKRGMRRASSLITLPVNPTGSAPPSPSTISDGSD